MLYAYKYILIVVLFVLPYLVLAYKNPFDRSLVTAFRFAMATVLVWGWLIACRFAVDFVDIRLADSSAQTREIYSGDGAKNAAVIMYGWVAGLILAFLSWMVARLRCYVRQNKLDNPPGSKERRF